MTPAPQATPTASPSSSGNGSGAEITLLQEHSYTDHVRVDAIIGVTLERAVDCAVDARGLSCPVPLLKCKRALGTLKSGQVVALITTDPRSVRDFQAFATQTGHVILQQAEQAPVFIHYVAKR